MEEQTQEEYVEVEAQEETRESFFGDQVMNELEKTGEEMDKAFDFDFGI